MMNMVTYSSGMRLLKASRIVAVTIVGEFTVTDLLVGVSTMELIAAWSVVAMNDTVRVEPEGIAALMASELGVEAHSMQKALETHVRAHFAELAEVKPEFR